MRRMLLLIAALCGASAHGETLHIRINQLGYPNFGVKTGIAFGNAALPPRFTVVDEKTKEVAFESKLVAVSGKWGQFTNHAELDFSRLRTTGRYFVQVGDHRSVPFNIRFDVYAEVPDQLIEFMHQQRCGYNPWLDAVCHPFDGRTAFGPLKDGSYLDASGGWHDAGDQLKYLLTSGNATAQLLLTYVLASEKIGGTTLKLGDRVNSLGQPYPNGVADVLDEGKWGLDWMLKLHPAPDHLYHQVADDRDHAGWRLPQDEHVDYGWGKGRERVVYFATGEPQGLKQHQSDSTGVANIAGRYAAAMGLAYQIWQDDPRMKAFADRCLQAGREVYELGRAREGVQQGNSYNAPYRYEETTWADDMEWGAAELFRATGDARYLEDAKRYSELAANDTWMGKEQTKHYQYYPFMNIGHFRLYDLVDKNTQKRLAGFYREGIEQCVTMGRRSPYRIGVPFIWCSNNLNVALVTQLLMYERMTGDKSYREFTAIQRDWLMGRNPWGTSMFTEIPEWGDFPVDVHLFANKLLKKRIRGGLVDGPVYERIFKSLKGVGITEPDPLASFQDTLAVYHDDIQDYSTNEPTMDGTASAILMWALCQHWSMSR